MFTSWLQNLQYLQRTFERNNSKKIHHFNEGLLKKNGSVVTNSDSSNSKTEDNTENVTINAPNDISAQQYYNSEFWEQKVDCIIAVLGKLISHNTLMHKHPVLIHSHSPQQSKHTFVQQLSSIHPVRSHKITSCHFSPQYSQSTLNGRLLSNTCTFITLTLYIQQTVF